MNRGPIILTTLFALLLPRVPVYAGSPVYPALECLRQASESR